MAISKCFEQMYKGDTNAILEGLTSNASLYRVNGIIASVRNENKSNPVIRQVKKLCDDTSCVFGYNTRPCVADFAIAALHLFGEKEYQGNDKTILDLIGCKMVFE